LFTKTRKTYSPFFFNVMKTSQVVRVSRETYLINAKDKRRALRRKRHLQSRTKGLSSSREEKCEKKLLKSKSWFSRQKRKDYPKMGFSWGAKRNRNVQKAKRSIYRDKKGAKNKAPLLCSVYYFHS
jgi:hypothetical protein